MENGLDYSKHHDIRSPGSPGLLMMYKILDRHLGMENRVLPTQNKGNAWGNKRPLNTFSLAFFLLPVVFLIFLMTFRKYGGSVMVGILRGSHLDLGEEHRRVEGKQGERRGGRGAKKRIVGGGIGLPYFYLSFLFFEVRYR